MLTPVHEINQKQISQDLAFHCEKLTGASAANSFVLYKVN